jgi:mannose/fructose/N-acetylgalactosamine-specific phosphotransferase system component IID
MPDTPRLSILNYAFRSYFIRLFYNYSNLFGEGMCYCLKPILLKDRLNKDPELIKRHLDFFNTNEYLSGFAIGIIINSETNKEAYETEKTKTVISSVLGSAGDELINLHIAPVLILIALNKFAVTRFNFDICLFWVIFSELAAFNIFNFAIRYYGIRSGIEKGTGCLKVFKSRPYKNILSILRIFRDLLSVFLIINLLILLFF